MREHIENILSKYCEMIDSFPLTDEAKRKSKEAVRISRETIISCLDKGDLETVKKGMHHLSMEITKMAAEFNSELCKINPVVGRSLVADVLQHLDERKVKAKYGDVILGEFSEMEKLLKDRTKVLESGFKRKDTLRVEDKKLIDNPNGITDAAETLTKGSVIINKTFKENIKTTFTTGRANGLIHINPRKFAAFFNVFYPLWTAKTISRNHYQSEYDFIINNFQTNGKDIPRSTISDAKNRRNWV